MHLGSEILKNLTEKTLLSLLVESRFALSSCGVQEGIDGTWDKRQALSLFIRTCATPLTSQKVPIKFASACKCTTRSQRGLVHPIECIFGGQHDSSLDVSDALYWLN